MNTLHVLCAEGDLVLTWDPADPASVATARQEVRNLAASGYSFFLVDGEPADEVSAGNGTLSCRRVEVEELLPSEDAPKPARAARAVASRPLTGG